ncbi:MAG: c-type cytochrome [Chloroflexi bacterium]|nr:c-type cytochrome [Chloroflexota bacterium]
MLKKMSVLVGVSFGLVFVGISLALAQEGDPEHGAAIYAANCAVCHGADAQGRIGVNLSQDFPSIQVDAFLQQTIADGVSGTRMPTWGQANGGPLSDQDIADVAAYVAGLAGGSEPIAPAPTFVSRPFTPAPGVTGDPVAGQVVFAKNCVMCHGEDAQGRIGAKLTKEWPSINPAAYIRTTVENGVDGSPMPAWLDANGGPLTKTDIDNVSAYLLSLNVTANNGLGGVAADGPISLGAGLAILVMMAVLIGAALVNYYRRA